MNKNEKFWWQNKTKELKTWDVISEKKNISKRLSRNNITNRCKSLLLQMSTGSKHRNLNVWQSRTRIRIRLSFPHILSKHLYLMVNKRNKKTITTTCSEKQNHTSKIKIWLFHEWVSVCCQTWDSSFSRSVSLVAPSASSIRSSLPLEWSIPCLKWENIPLAQIRY